MFLKQTKISPIGLDISDRSVKMIQLRQSGNKIILQALNKVSLPEGILEYGLIKDREKLTKAIQKLMYKPKMGTFYDNEAVISLPEPRTYIKLIKIEKSPNDIKNIIENEIEKNIPVAIDEIYYDWQKVKESSEAEYVLVGAAPRTIVDDYFETVNGANLSIVASEIEAAAICRSLLAEESPNHKPDKKIGNYGIIDIGAKRSSLAIYSGNSLVLSISIPISSHKATEKISKNLEINRDQAEKAKIICGLDETKAKGIVKNILTDMISDLTVRIRNGIEYYNNHYPELGPINKLILCGGGANIKDLDKMLAKELFIDTSYGNIFTHINQSKENLLIKFKESHDLDMKILKTRKSDIVTVKQDSSLCFATAMGLALRNIFTDII